MIRNIKWLLLVALTIAACSKEDEKIIDNNSSDGLPLTSGTADFSKYVALGDSFAAGFSDNALFIEGQKGAYPNILAQQFALVGGGTFTTPFMNDNVGGFIGGTPQAFGPRLYLAPPASAGASPTPTLVSEVSTTNPTIILSGRPFNNMGVPGAKCIHLDFSGYGSSAGNPYFARFASSPLATIVEDAVAQNPTFFSLWIGGNDVLGFATSGGVNTNEITAPAVFDAAYNNIVNKLTSGGRKGVIANLPYINALPFFTTVPTNPVPLDLASAQALNAGLLGPVDAILTAYGEPDRIVPLAASATNPLLIIDESLKDYKTEITNALIAKMVPAAQATLMGNLYGQARHARNTGEDRDYILLTTRSIIGGTQVGYPASFSKIGISFPLQDAAVLTADEASKIKTATDAYNVTIKSAAETKGLAMVDTKSILNQLITTGITANGYTLNSTFVTGGAFSLDGVHPSPRGYALIANEFMKEINEKYGSNLKAVNFADYRIMFTKAL